MGGSAPPVFTVSGGNIILICHGPVIVTDRPLGEVLRELDKPAAKSAKASGAPGAKRTNVRRGGGSG